MQLISPINKLFRNILAGIAQSEERSGNDGQYTDFE